MVVEADELCVILPAVGSVETNVVDAAVLLDVHPAAALAVVDAVLDTTEEAACCAAVAVVSVFSTMVVVDCTVVCAGVAVLLEEFCKSAGPATKLADICPETAPVWSPVDCWKLFWKKNSTEKTL